MNPVKEQAIVLTRTNFGEADRILTVLTPGHGKVRIMAKGVRKIKSKLAGGIELFSVSQITYIVGRGEIHTLVSTRLQKHHGNIAKNIERTMYGYDILKMINKNTEDGADREYFDTLAAALTGLGDEDLPLDMLKLWLNMRLLKLGGHSPNLRADSAGQPLLEKGKYIFNFGNMTFVSNPSGPFLAGHIKLVRLVLGLDDPLKLKKLKQADTALAMCNMLAVDMLRQFTKS